MTEDDAKKRIAAIEKLQNQFDNRLGRLDRDLLSDLLAAADSILASPQILSRLLGDFEKQYHEPILQKFGADLLTIGRMNDSYFADAVGETMGAEVVNQALFDSVKDQVGKQLTSTFGIKPDGKVVSGGLFDLFTKDTTVRRQIQQFAYAQKSAGVGLEKFKKNLKSFVVGSPDNPNAPAKGVWNRHYNTVAYDTYQQADRVAQQTFASGLNMTAFLYLGGTIAGTRLFCRMRDGKVFLKGEIDKFGTPSDTYGGYEDKSTGFFSGKPKGGYSPFIHAGGYGCRHHFSAISDREAIRRRPDLMKATNGTLGIRSQQPVEQQQQKLSEAEKAAKLDLLQKTKEATTLTYFNDYKAKVKRLDYKAHFPQLNLTQAAIINGYTASDFYFQLNGYLRTKATSGAVLPQYDAVTAVLTDALEKIPTSPGLVYRGSALTPGQQQEYIDAFTNQTPYIEQAFVSTSQLYQKSFRGNTKWFIEQKSGRFIGPISESKTEMEVLIPAGKSFRVTNVQSNQGMTVIYMEEI